MTSTPTDTVLNSQIRQYLGEIGGAVEGAPARYTVGDGVSWFQEVGNEHDRGRIRSAKLELRRVLVEKITRYKEQTTTGRTHAPLLDQLQLAIQASDSLLMRAATTLIGLRGSKLISEVEDIVRR